MAEMTHRPEDRYDAVQHLLYQYNAFHASRAVTMHVRAQSITHANGDSWMGVKPLPYHGLKRYLKTLETPLLPWDKVIDALDGHGTS